MASRYRYPQEHKAPRLTQESARSLADVTLEATDVRLLAVRIRY